MGNCQIGRIKGVNNSLLELFAPFFVRSAILRLMARKTVITIISLSITNITTHPSNLVENHSVAYLQTNIYLSTPPNALLTNQNPLVRIMPLSLE